MGALHPGRHQSEAGIRGVGSMKEREDKEENGGGAIAGALDSEESREVGLAPNHVGVGTAAARSVPFRFVAPLQVLLSSSSLLAVVDTHTPHRPPPPFTQSPAHYSSYPRR